MVKLCPLCGRFYCYSRHKKTDDTTKCILLLWTFHCKQFISSNVYLGNMSFFLQHILRNDRCHPPAWYIIILMKKIKIPSHIIFLCWGIGSSVCWAFGVWLRGSSVPEFESPCRLKITFLSLYLKLVESIMLKCRHNISGNISISNPKGDYGTKNSKITRWLGHTKNTKRQIFLSYRYAYLTPT